MRRTLENFKALVKEQGYQLSTCKEHPLESKVRKELGSTDYIVKVTLDNTCLYYYFDTLIRVEKWLRDEASPLKIIFDY